MPVMMGSAVTPDAGAGRDAGGGADGSVGAMDGATDAPRRYAGFGDPCTTDKDCKLDATFCGLGQCTAIDCLDAPELCPPEWICYDVLKVMPDSEVASACVPPGVL